MTKFDCVKLEVLKFPETYRGIKLSRLDSDISIAIEWCECNMNVDEPAIARLIAVSNSPLTPLFYVLRKDITDIDLINQYIEICKRKFIGSAYSNVSRSDSLKKRNAVNKFSRGTTGYTEIMPDGKNYYCRSTNEFVFVNYFFKSWYPKYNLTYESKFYKFGDVIYKPDYHIFNERNKLIGIVEVKDPSFVDDDYYNKIQEEFNNIGIKFDIFKNIKMCYSEYPELKQMVVIWKNKETTHSNTAGILNPSYSGHTSDELLLIFKAKFIGYKFPINKKEMVAFAKESHLPATFKKSNFRELGIPEIRDIINKENGFEYTTSFELRELRRQHDVFDIDYTQSVIKGRQTRLNNQLNNVKIEKVIPTESRICSNCGIEFTTPIKSKGRYCSIRCKNIVSNKISQERKREKLNENNKNNECI